VLLFGQTTRNGAVWGVDLKCFLNIGVRRDGRAMSRVTGEDDFVRMPYGQGMWNLVRRGAWPWRTRAMAMEWSMNSTSEQSLRFQVEKWLAPSSTAQVHVTEFSRTRLGRRRYVCVETSLPGGSRALFFFRHDDGSWCVFPPTDDSPRMTADRLAA
jgi:hypothetical protein